MSADDKGQPADAEVDQERIDRDRAKAEAPDWGPPLSRMERIRWWLLVSDLEDEDEDDEMEGNPW